MLKIVEEFTGEPKSGFRGFQVFEFLSSPNGGKFMGGIEFLSRGFPPSPLHFWLVQIEMPFFDEVLATKE